jgi:hypothetical protein
MTLRFRLSIIIMWDTPAKGPTCIVMQMDNDNRRRTGPFGGCSSESGRRESNPRHSAWEAVSQMCPNATQRHSMPCNVNALSPPLPVAPRHSVTPENLPLETELGTTLGTGGPTLGPAQWVRPGRPAGHHSRGTMHGGTPLEEQPLRA